MTTRNLPPELDTDLNRLVLERINLMSAHSELSDALLEAVKPVGDVQIFCPNWMQYRYVVASTKSIVFCGAIGMNTLLFRLDDVLKIRAFETGGVAFPDFGPDWVSFTLFRDDWPKTDLRFWALKAYRYAREMP